MEIQVTCPNCGKTTQMLDLETGAPLFCNNCNQALGRPHYVVQQKLTNGQRVAYGIAAATVAIIVVLTLLPRETISRSAARRVRSTNNMKQIGLGLINYHDSYNCFPSAVVRDADGAQLFSGRVLLLPYIESSPRFQDYDKLAPWTSPNNRAIADDQKYGALFEDPADCNGMPGRSNYLFVTGPQAFCDDDHLTSFADVTDGASTTIHTLEAKDSQIHWTEPKDYRIDDLKKVPPGNHTGGTFVGFADGSVRQLSANIDPTVWRALLTRDGGEAIKAP